MIVQLFVQPREDREYESANLFRRLMIPFSLASSRLETWKKNIDRYSLSVVFSFVLCDIRKIEYPSKRNRCLLMLILPRHQPTFHLNATRIYMLRMDNAWSNTVMKLTNYAHTERLVRAAWTHFQAAVSFQHVLFSFERQNVAEAHYKNKYKCIIVCMASWVMIDSQTNMDWKKLRRERIVDSSVCRN